MMVFIIKRLWNILFALVLVCPNTYASFWNISYTEFSHLKKRKIVTVSILATLYFSFSTYKNACKWSLLCSVFQCGNVSHLGSNVTYYCLHFAIFTGLKLIIHLPFLMWIMSILIPTVIISYTEILPVIWADIFYQNFT